jgi:hypothetical protein
MIHPQVLDHLKAKIAEIVAERARLLATGVAKDWSDYQRRVGYIEGLERIQSIIDEIIEDKKDNR